jgi:hypothetical protein
MQPFPEPHELIGLFEGEPEETDPGLEWKYNLLRFVRTRDRERMECSIHEADREVGFRWSVDGTDRVVLDLHDVVGLSVYREKDREGLALTLGSDRFHPIRIDIAPSVRVVVRDDAG